LAGYHFENTRIKKELSWLVQSFGHKRLWKLQNKLLSCCYWLSPKRCGDQQQHKLRTQIKLTNKKGEYSLTKRTRAEATQPGTLTIQTRTVA